MLPAALLIQGLVIGARWLVRMCAKCSHRHPSQPLTSLGLVLTDVANSPGASRRTERSPVQFRFSRHCIRIYLPLTSANSRFVALFFPAYLSNLPPVSSPRQTGTYQHDLNVRLWQSRSLLDRQHYLASCVVFDIRSRDSPRRLPFSRWSPRHGFKPPRLAVRQCNCQEEAAERRRDR